MAKTALDEFADRLHTKPAAGQEQEDAYYTDLAARLPTVIDTVKFKKPRTGDKLTTEQTAELLAAVSSKLDSVSSIQKDKDGKVISGHVSAEQSFTTLIHKTMDEKKELSITALQAGITKKPDTLEGKDKEQNFRWMMTSAHTGLANRDPSPRQAAWTFENIQLLIQALLNGDINALQKFMQGNGPKAGVNHSAGIPADLSSKMANINLENPKIKAACDLTEFFMNDIHIQANGSLDNSREGPFTQAEIDRIHSIANDKTHPECEKYKRAIDHINASAKPSGEKPKSLETEIQESLERNQQKLAEFAEKHNLGPNQIEALKESITNRILANTGPIDIIEGHSRTLYLSHLHVKNAAQEAGKMFGAKLNDPSMKIAVTAENVDLINTYGVVNNTFSSRDTPYFSGMNSVDENFAWRLAMEAGLETNGKTYDQYTYVDENRIRHTSLGGMPPETQDFIKRARELMEKAIKDSGGDETKAYDGAWRRNLEIEVAKRVREDDVLGPILQKQLEIKAAAQEALGKLPKTDPRIFNDINFDLGNTLASSGPQSIKFTDKSMTINGPDGKPALYLNIESGLELSKPNINKDADGKTNIGFDQTKLTAPELKAAMEWHIKQGGTIETQMLAKQDGDTTDSKASVVGVQLIMKDKTGGIVANPVLHMGQEAGMDMDRSAPYLKTLQQGINQDGIDNKGPGVGYNLGGIKPHQINQATPALPH